MRIKLYDFCLKYEKENLLDEWDTEKNNPKTPHDVTYEAKRKYGGAAQKAMSGRQRFIPEPG